MKWIVLLIFLICAFAFCEGFRWYRKGYEKGFDEGYNEAINEAMERLK